MSLVGLVDDFVERQSRAGVHENGPEDERLLREAEAARTGSDDSLVREITKYVPAEALTIYVAILPLVSPEEDIEKGPYVGRWVLSIVVLLLMPFLVLSYYRARARKASVAGGRPWLRTFAAMVAFVAWVAAIPSSPFNTFGFYQPEYSLPILACTSVLLGAIARYTGFLDP